MSIKLIEQAAIQLAAHSSVGQHSGAVGWTVAEERVGVGCVSPGAQSALSSSFRSLEESSIFQVQNWGPVRLLAAGRGCPPLLEAPASLLCGPLHFQTSNDARWNTSWATRGEKLCLSRARMTRWVSVLVHQLGTWGFNYTCEMPSRQYLYPCLNE